MNNVINVVTACLNSRSLIDETVMSIITQRGNFNLKYHIQDGGSDDGTLERLQFWQELLNKGGLPLGCRDLQFSYSVHKDTGLYDGLNNAFEILEVSQNNSGWMTWVNAGDIIQPGALELLFQVSRDIPELRWIGGRRSMANSKGCQFEILAPYPYVSKTIKVCLHDGRKLPYLQQEGVFWRSDLWNEVGGQLDATLTLAGDFDLWRRFSHYADFNVVNSVLGSFRMHEGQLSEDKNKYHEEIDKIILTDGVKEEYLSVWSELLTVIKNSPDDTKERESFLKQHEFCGQSIFFIPREKRWKLFHLPHTGIHY